MKLCRKCGTSMMARRRSVDIQMHIGRRPLAAFGNADGDQAMLQ